MNRADLIKDTTDTGFNSYGNDNYRAYNDGCYTRTNGYYDRPSNLNEQKPEGYNGSGTFKERLTAIAAQAAEKQRQKDSEMVRRMNEMMEILPKNSYDAQWVNEQTPDIKRIKKLMLISSILIYGGTAIGFGTVFFQKITSTFYDADISNDVWGFVLPIIGLIIYYFYSIAFTQKIKKCTVMVNGLIVSYKVHSSSDSGNTYAPVFGFNFNDRNYTVPGSLYSSGIPEIGKEVRLYIDAKEPTSYFQPEHDRSSVFFITFFCAFFIGIGFFVLFF